MACKLNEIVILKSSAVQLDQDTMMLLNCMYHTADKEAKRNGADKSFYRYEGRVMKIADFKAMIDDYKSDAHAMETWTWPTKDPWWKPEYFISYFGDKTKKVASKWYKNRLSKIMSWDNFLKLAKDGVKMTAKGPKTSDSAKYELNDYVTEDGQKFSIDTPETMLKLVNKSFGHPIVLKRELPKA